MSHLQHDAWMMNQPLNYYDEGHHDERRVFSFRCMEFTFTAIDDMDGEDLSCVAVFPGLDPLEERDLRKSAKFELGDGESSSSSSRNSRSSIKLLDADDDELVICAKGKRSGQSLEFKIEFESDPEPESVR